jgi:hypothetical protein
MVYTSIMRDLPCILIKIKVKKNLVDFVSREDLYDDEC